MPPQPSHRTRRSLAALVAGLLCLRAATAAPPPPAEDHDDPDAELRSFKVADGYEVNLFASEKDGVVKPVQMRRDPRGRLWISCIPSYPQIKPGETADDRVIILEDTAGTGHATQSTVFARGLSLPLGLELGDGGIYVSSGTDLLFIKDNAEGKETPDKHVVLRGFFTGDDHQDINNFIWGPGGELMFCQGLHAFSRVETPWGVERLDKAGVWRLRPRTMKLESFLGNDRGPQNPWGIAFDDWGQPIMVAGNGQGIYYMEPLLIRTDHFLDPHQIWTKSNVKFSGPDILGTRALPDDAQGLLVAGSILNNAVYWFRLNESGSGFWIKDLPPLIVSSHRSFRPIDAKVGPDGAIYILDWYNPIIGHYQASLRHPDRDHAHGRVWRVTAKGRPLVKPPEGFAQMGPAQLFEQFRSPERWVRYQSKRLLAAMEGPKVLAALGPWVEKLAPSDPQYENLLVQAIGVYEDFETPEPELLKKLLSARDYRARAYATSIIGHWHDRLSDPIALLAKQAGDEQPRVRLEAIVAASYVPDARAMEAAAVAADFPTDAFLQYAFTQTTHALKPYWKPAFDAGQLTFDHKTARIEAVCKADGSPDVLKPLIDALAGNKVTGAGRADLLALVASAGGPGDLAIVLRDVAQQPPTPETARVLEAMSAGYRLRRVKPAGDPAALLRTLADAHDSPARAAALELIGLLGLESLRGSITSAAQEATASPAVRQAAINALAELSGVASSESLAPLAKPGQPTGVRLAAVAALARLDANAAAKAAVALLPDLGASEGQIAALGAAFWSRQAGSDALAAAMAKATVPKDSAKLLLRAMNAAGRQDAPLRDALTAASGVQAAANNDYDAGRVKSLVADALAHGDPAAGEKVFRSAQTGCLACHSVGGAGGRTGPDLSPVGTALPADLVVESVLWPQKQVKEGYTATLVETRDGQTIQGYRVSEDAKEFTLRDPPTGKLIRVPQGQIRRKREIGSLMPEGLTDALTATELRDLLRFLTDLGKPGPYRVSGAPLVRSWQVLTVTPAGEGLPEAEPTSWAPRVATVAGELPAADVLPPGSDVGWVRCEIEVLKPGRFTVELGDSRGLKLWTDGQPVLALPAVDVEWPVGRHALTFRVDRRGRDSAGLRCQVYPAAPSTGEARPVNEGDDKVTR